MSIPTTPVLLFRRGLSLWLLGCLVFLVFSTNAIDSLLLSPAYVPPGPFTWLTHFLFRVPAATEVLWIVALCIILALLALHALFFRSRWWVALLSWLIYVNLMNRSWLSGSGGQQLAANLLFWNVFLGIGSSKGAGQWLTSVGPTVRATAFWIIRLQLLLAYFATALHKLTGTHWLDGSAMAIVATDPAFDLRWVAGMPLVSMALTWSVLLFQLTFPLAVWWRRSRIPWMLAGVVFHLATAWWMGIPEMAFAFILSYPIWLDEDQACGMMAFFRLQRTRSQ
jgi:hypothetical protein